MLENAFSVVSSDSSVGVGSVVVSCNGSVVVGGGGVSSDGRVGVVSGGGVLCDSSVSARVVGVPFDRSVVFELPVIRSNHGYKLPFTIVLSSTIGYEQKTASPIKNLKLS